MTVVRDRITDMISVPATVQIIQEVQLTEISTRIINTMRQLPTLQSGQLTEVKNYIMRYYLSVPEDGRGQEVFRPKHYQIDAGEEVEVDKATYDEHHDRDCFEARTDSETSEQSSKTGEESDGSEESEEE